MIFLGVLLPFSTADAFGGVVTSPYGWRFHPVYGTQRFHAGIDIGDIPKGTPIPSLVTGTVAFSGSVSGYGNYIAVKDDATGRYVAFAHCDTLLFGVGTRVNEGQAIATVGSTGIGTGVHIHVELRKELWGNNVEIKVAPKEYFHSKCSMPAWVGPAGAIFD